MILTTANVISDRAYTRLLKRYGDDNTVFAAADGAGSLRDLCHRLNINPDA